MRCVVQKCAQASVTGGGRTASIGAGLCVLVGIHVDDGPEEASKMIKRLLGLKIFSDDDSPQGGERWTKDTAAKQAEILLVPQFTLYAAFKSGRPSFHRSMKPESARPYFDDFVKQFRETHPSAVVEMGMFGERMEVSLVNSGVSCTRFCLEYISPRNLECDLADSLRCISSLVSPLLLIVLIVRHGFLTLSQ